MRIGRLGVFAGLALLLRACAEAPQAPVPRADQAPWTKALLEQRGNK